MMGENKTIYCISGLGADHRIFSKLDLGPDVRLHHLPWINPESDESIESYASRMAEGIHDDHPVLMGVSFGGMISVEISRLMQVRKVILISSIKSKKEKPFYFRAAAALRLNKVISLKPYNFLEPFENYNLGISTKEEKALAREYRQHFNPHFSDWAVDRIINWQNNSFPENILHIHGSDDHVFPIRYVNPTNVIDGGGHLMIMSRAGEISSLIKTDW